MPMELPTRWDTRRRSEYIRFMRWAEQIELPSRWTDSSHARLFRKIRRACIDAFNRCAALEPQRRRVSALHTAYRRRQ